MKRFDLDMTRGATSDVDIIPPPSFSRGDYPFGYMLVFPMQTPFDGDVRGLTNDTTKKVSAKPNRQTIHRHNRQDHNSQYSTSHQDPHIHGRQRRLIHSHETQRRPPPNRNVGQNSPRNHLSPPVPLRGKTRLDEKSPPQPVENSRAAQRSPPCNPIHRIHLPRWAMERRNCPIRPRSPHNPRVPQIPNTNVQDPPPRIRSRSRRRRKEIYIPQIRESIRNHCRRRPLNHHIIRRHN